MKKLLIILAMGLSFFATAQNGGYPPERSNPENYPALRVGDSLSLPFIAPATGDTVVLVYTAGKVDSVNIREFRNDLSSLDIERILQNGNAVTNNNGILFDSGTEETQDLIKLYSFAGGDTVFRLWAEDGYRVQLDVTGDEFTINTPTIFIGDAEFQDNLTADVVETDTVRSRSATTNLMLKKQDELLGMYFIGNNVVIREPDTLERGAGAIDLQTRQPTQTINERAQSNRSFIAGGYGHRAGSEGSGSSSLYSGTDGNNFVGGGHNNIASSHNTAVVGGEYNIAQTLGSVAVGGVSNDAQGSRSATLGGEYGSAIGVNSVKLGGDSIFALSYSEVVVGQFTETYTPNSAGSWDAGDPLVRYGIGDSDSLLDGLVYYKSGFSEWNSIHDSIATFNGNVKINGNLTASNIYTIAEVDALVSDFNPNSQPIALRYFERGRDSLAIAQNYNAVNTDIGLLLNVSSTSGKNLMQQASLVFSPAVSDSALVYCIKPDDGSKDLAFSRSGAANFTNENGEIESAATNVPRLDFGFNPKLPALAVDTVKTNLFRYSAQFDNATWSRAASGAGTAPTVTANYATAPDGTMTADRMQFSAGGATASDRSILRQLVTLPATSNTMSFYVKSNAGAGNQTLAFTFNSGNTTVFNLTEDYWTRVDYTGTGTGAASFYGMEAVGNKTMQTVDALISGADLKTGTELTAYIPTVATTASTSAESAEVSTTGLFGTQRGTIVYTVGTGSDTRLFQLQTATDTLFVYRENDSIKLNIQDVATTIGISEGTDEIGISFSGSSINVVLNGADEVSAAVGFTQTYTNLEIVGRSQNIYGIEIFPIVVSESNLKTLTQ